MDYKNPVYPKNPSKLLNSLNVLYADDELLVFNKPAGLLAVPGRGPDKADALSARAQQHWPAARVVHRLDMATSGLMLMAQTARMHAALGRLFEARRVLKIYSARVAGLKKNGAALQHHHILRHQDGVDWPHGHDWPLWAHFQPPARAHWIVAPMMPDWPRRPRQKIDVENGKAAQTLFWLEYVEDFPENPNWIMARLSLMPLTGRTHQLRLHLAHIGWPIIGDALYAPNWLAQWATRLHLHARVVGFEHPFSGQWMQFECPAPF